MAFDANQFRQLIVEPTLHALDPDIPFSPVAVELLMLTCATESALGTYLHQLGAGPALGVYQMEPATWESHDDWLIHHANLDKKIGHGHVAEDMVYDLRYATQMARVHMWRYSSPLPSDDDPDELLLSLAWYYKHAWNTMAGKATVDKAVADYRRYVLGEA